ncbi:MAG: hypothetical protein HEEMFOPI_00386 [Holosporales bacterium]
MAPLFLIYGKAFLGQLIFISSAFCYFFALLNQKKQSVFLKSGSVLLFSSYLLLTACFAFSDFSLKVVSQYSSINTPLIYKIVAVWGSSEGAFLLFLTLLSMTGWILKTKVSKTFFAFHILSLILLQLFLMPPFETQVIQSSSDLNPLLQDCSMVFHPPILYMGQIFWGMIFFKMMDHPFDITEIKKLLHFGFLTLMVGIFLGCYWAYYVLGWGGFWYWDPVENVSLFGLLFYVLCFHLLKFKKERLFFKCIVYGWPVTLFGSFLIRSGVLNSVHSFAENLDFSLYAFIVFIVTIAPSLFYILGMKNPFELEKGKESSFFEYGSFIIWGAVFLILVLAVLIPVFFKNISFSLSFFARSIWPLSVMGIFLMPFVSFSLRSREVQKSLFFKMALLPILLFLNLFLFLSYSLLFCLTMSVALFSLIGTFYIFYHFKKSIAFLLAHIGVILMLTSSVLTTYLKEEERITFLNDKDQCICPLQNGDVIEVLSTKAFKEKNYIAHEITLRWVDNTQKDFILRPTFKYFIDLKTPKSDMALMLNGLHQKGVVIEQMTEEKLQVFVFEKKYILLVWGAFIFMILGLLRGLIRF